MEDVKFSLCMNSDGASDSLFQHNIGDYDKIINDVASCKVKIDTLIIHYTGMPNLITPESITYFHKQVHKWSVDGYNYYLRFDGHISELEKPGTLVAGCLMTSGQTGNYNALKSAIQLCFETPNPEMKMNRTQDKSLEYIIKGLINKIPNIKIAGHREFVEYFDNNGNVLTRQKTQCPNEDFHAYLTKKEIDAKNIYCPF